MRIIHSQIETISSTFKQRKKLSAFNKQFSPTKKVTGFIKTSESYWMQNAKIDFKPMHSGQLFTKRIIDIIGSVFSLIIFFPILLFLAIRTKLSSPGPIFYFQERVGKNGKRFKLIKFRSMVLKAEKHGPQLSHRNDSRITPWGKTMRYWRLDELPQLWNILKGEMSFVGPRPERNCFAKQLIEILPSYKKLQQIKPGLSSYGMVRFGYAENIEEMLERSRYDFMYLRNPSLIFDFKVVIGTFKVIFLNTSKHPH